MSALDDIKTYILAHYGDDDPDYVARIMPQIEAEAQELYDVVAAELAEKARKIMGLRQLPSGAEPERIARYVAGWHDAIDFIDPEVEAS
ncbi:hypothetical protein [Streptomyces sp. or20]|uniref:hypothetical protein n=1 Tax=Streptomyces sp. or20 TaxID=1828016 RepID=UPI000BEF824C|nr:hypothetical protein [Streptomyces sp. or20]